MPSYFTFSGVTDVTGVTLRLSRRNREAIVTIGSLLAQTKSFPTGRARRGGVGDRSSRAAEPRAMSSVMGRYVR
jgi:hypothetical protein